MLSVSVSGCAGYVEASLIDPAKYNYHSCQQLEAAKQREESRERDLLALKKRTASDAVGGIISFATYEADYRSARGEVRLIEEVKKSKQCPSPANDKSEKK